MKQKLLAKTAFCLVLATGLLHRAAAQTEVERQQIKAAYQAAAIKNGKGADALQKQTDSIKARYQQAEARVKTYLQQHPGQHRYYTIHQQLFFIQDIRPNGTPIVITTKDRECGSVIKSDAMYSGGSLGISISGQSMVAGVWDGGLVRTTHELFQNRALIKDNATMLSNHMCHVAGDLMGGDIAANRRARGIAYNATAWCYDWNNDATEYSQFGTDGYLVSNHSYGRGNTNEQIWSFGAYDNVARNLDAVLALRPNYLQVWAGGNEQSTNNNRPTKAGYDVMTGTSVSKNILCVGALNADATMTDYSNWGPTDDGRIKPDICAKGSQMTSAYSGGDNYYTTGNGTSYAAPSISGLALLLQQYYKTLNPDYLEAAGVRGLMMHTATDLGQPGPDYKFGWGMANGEKASQTIMTANADFTQTNSNSKIAKITTNPAVGASTTYTVKAAGSTPLSISVSWTDDAGPEQVETDGIDPTTGRLVYNFDIMVTAPDGTTVFYPWSGPGMANRTANATRTGPNNADNFKRVDIDAPVAGGVYTITITKRTGSPATDRAFMLMATGLINTLPAVNFNQPVNTVPEATTATAATCVNYKDYSFPVSIANAPAANATVTLMVDAASTAAEGKHFDLSTNGIFGAGGSKTLTFPAGNATAQSYTVRVYDDAIVNPNEVIQLSFSVNGGGAVAGNMAAKTLIYIADNDNAVAATGPAPAMIGNDDNLITGAQGPFSRTEADLLMDHYFTAAELTAAGLSAGSNITALTLTLAGKVSRAAFPNFNIRMGHTSEPPTTTSSFLAATSAGYTTCYTNAAYTSVPNDNTFTFTTPFVWNGTDNVVVRYCYNGTTDRLVQYTGTDSAYSDKDDFLCKPNALGTGVNAVVFNYENASANADGCALPTNSFVKNHQRPVTRFTYTKPGTAIETAAAATKTENLNSTTGQYNFYSASNKLIASISNPNQNGACTEARIETAGNGFTAFSSGQRSNKVWRITPAANASTNSYTVTLYMTAAELAGQNPATLKVIKSSAADVASMDFSNSVAATTTVVSNNEYSTFTATFTGFSLFSIGTSSVILPLQSIKFAGIKAAGYNQLTWQTTGEQNTRSFELESSTDGIIFNLKASIEAKGSGNNSYRYNDATPFVGRIFYRLKVIDTDGKFTYSNVVLITGEKQPLVTLFPNPARDVVNIFTGSATQYKKASLYTADGRLLQSFTLTTNLQKVVVASLAKGIYLLKFEDGTVLRFIKE